MFTNNNLYKTTKFQPFSLNYYSQILEQPKNLSNTEFKKYKININGLSKI